MQFTFLVGVMVRLEHVGHCRTHLPHRFRAVVLRRFGRFLKYNIVTMQPDRDPFLQTPNLLTLPALDFDPVSVDIVQAEHIVFDCKDTVRAITNHLWIGVVASGKREANGAHEHIGFRASGDDS